ncbi:TRAP transporter large permease [Sinirhodobacter huangdaonensis]|uniref:TRAP transporter large permease protein n=1 Tax=Paenirhodobacter huangdaonensis TaxID=2501515 RepID=A0A3S3PB29_9RHOB|nr:TRAP transporter large permease [Sinirhodobacter huangdaonensis]RWR47366.1 TRAP transporter large permease [Sinirhodobacter huangdaonensis]
MESTTLVFGALVVLLLLGVEILTVIGLGAVLLTLITDQFPLLNVSLTMFDSLNLFPLLALPLFVVTGDLIAAGGIAAQIMRFSQSLVGWVRGGLALTTIVASGIFAAISGSNAATVATVGKVVLPEMSKQAYDRNFAAATVAAGGVVGIIIPPSVAFVLYGVATGLSVTDLFIAGIIPGLLMVGVMCVVAYVISRKRKFGDRTQFSVKGVLSSAIETRYALGAIAIILVGIYSGMFTPTEAGAVAAVYCLFVAVAVTRKLKLRDVPGVLVSSSRICGLVVPIIAVAMVLSQNLTMLRIPDAVVSGMLGWSDDPTVVLIMIVALLLVAGSVMEAAPNILIFAPMLAPIARQLGIDPVHFGVIVVSTLAVGFITPPVGLNLFVASATSGAGFASVTRAAIPYVVALLLCCLVIAFIPWLSLAFV